MVKETVVFALTSSTDLAASICKHLGLPLGKIKVEHFADGEILVEPQESVRGRSVFIIQSTCNPVSERLMEVLICIDACRRASAGEINVIMPYYGYARQDRKAKPRQPITSKLVANLLQVAGAHRVVTFDLHAAQIQGYFDIPIDDITAVPMLASYFKGLQIPKDELVVVSPDHGGVTRARKLADALNTPIAIIDKRRPKPNVAEVMNIVGNIEGKTCILIDDIIDTAGTITNAANALIAKGAKKVYITASHGVFSGKALDNITNSKVEKCVVTDTIPQDKNLGGKIEVVSVAQYFAKAIDRINNNRPVSMLFDGR